LLACRQRLRVRHIKRGTSDLAGLQRGADSIYLFNYMDPAPMTGGKDAYRALLQEGLSLESVLRSQTSQAGCLVCPS
jgi:hypothetical protein